MCGKDVEQCSGRSFGLKAGGLNSAPALSLSVPSFLAGCSLSLDLTFPISKMIFWGSSSCGRLMFKKALGIVSSARNQKEIKQQGMDFRGQETESHPANSNKTHLGLPATHMVSISSTLLICCLIYLFNKFIYFIYLLLAALGLRCYIQLSLVAASGGYSSLWCSGFSLRWFSCCGAWALGTWASVVVARGLSSCGLRALESRPRSCGARA